VHFDPQTAAALRRWRTQQSEEKLSFGPAWRSGLSEDLAFVVTEPDGKVVHPDTLAARWSAAVKVAGVTPITLHSVRHSYAELALSAGVRLDQVSRQLGHASISTTADNYLHDNNEAATEAALRVAEAIGGGNAR
jgi:integrase